MSKTLLLTTIAMMMGGLALAAVPHASAFACAAQEPRNLVTDYVTHECTYYVGNGEAVREVTATVDFLGAQAIETVDFIVDTYGDQLP